MKTIIEKLQEFKQWILSIVIGFFDLSTLGFFIIYSSFGIFGETIMWSGEMWVQIFGVAIGGTILIRYGRNSR